MGVKGLLTYIKHRINWEDERRASVGEYGKSSLPPSLPPVLTTVSASSSPSF